MPTERLPLLDVSKKFKELNLLIILVSLVPVERQIECIENNIITAQFQAEESTRFTAVK